MNTCTQIRSFFAEGPIAVAGVSRSPLKFGNLAYKTLSSKAHLDLLPINPHTDSIFDQACFHNIATLPRYVKSLILFTHPEDTASMLLQAMKKGIRNIWIQRGSESPEALALAGLPGYNIIFGKCVIMHALPKESVSSKGTSLVKDSAAFLTQRALAFN